jgi:hypothetical protein
MTMFPPSRPRTFLIAAAAILFPFGPLLAAENAATRPAAPAGSPTASATTAPSNDQAVADRKEQEITRVMEFLRVTQPDVYEQARSFREADPARFEKLIRGALGTVNRLEDVKRRDPRLFELKMKDLELAYKSLRLARELQRPDLAAADRARMSEELTTAVTTEFDVCQQMREHEIASMRTRLQDLDKQLQERAKDKDALIKQRMQDLVEKPARLEW